MRPIDSSKRAIASSKRSSIGSNTQSNNYRPIPQQRDMEIFHYPDATHLRRHAPRGYRDYTSYKPWLRDEFTFQCVYCLCRERWFPDGETAFSVDHLRPYAVAPEHHTNYDNLVYACCQCNAGAWHRIGA